MSRKICETIQSHAKWKKNRESCLHEGALFLEFHMAKNNIEMQRKRNRDGALNRQENKKNLGEICYA